LRKILTSIAGATSLPTISTRLLLFTLTALIILTVPATPSPAAVIQVPGDAATLAAACQQAQPGDRILLAAGQHLADNVLVPDSIVIEGNVHDPASVIIVASGAHRALRAHGIERTELRGLTIQGGRADGSTNYASSGGALMISHAAAWLHRVHFRDNQATGSGGAIQVLYGQVFLSECRFTDNHAQQGGGALDISYDSNATLAQTDFSGNSAAWGGALSIRTLSSCWLTECSLTDNTAIGPQELGGAFFSDYAATVAFYYTVMAGNSARLGGAARLNSASSSFVNCTIDGNSASQDGAGFMVRNSTINVFRSILSFNEGTPIGLEESSLLLASTNVFGNTDGDWVGVLEPLRDQDQNMEADPLFCGPGDHHLQAESPCAPTNNPVGLIGAKDVGCSSEEFQLLSFEAERHFHEVQLSWTGTGPEPEFQLQGFARSGFSNRPWTVPYRSGEEPGSFLAIDKPQNYQAALVYILEARLPGGQWSVIGQLELDPVNTTMARGLTVEGIYPNPFNPQVTIQFSLSNTSPVEVAIYDLQGRRLRILAEGELPAGVHHLVWDGRDADQRSQPTGTYLLRIVSEGKQHTAKLLLVK